MNHVSKTHYLFIVPVILSFLFGCFSGQSFGATAEQANAPAPAFHRIKVIDRETGRGIPAVELKLTDSRIFYTDSAGIVAFYEPDLMGKEVFFHIKSFGYSYPYGYETLGYSYPEDPSRRKGKAFRITPGGNTVIKMDRRNIAQRLYRLTGSGIYRDSRLLGDKIPPTQDTTDEPAMGMDSALAIIYQDKMFWIFGDTLFASKLIGNFRVTGATSQLPSKGGLDPDAGVALSYFRDGPRIKPMVNDEHKVIWLEGLRVARDESGNEHLFANYLKIKSDGSLESQERGLLEYNDKTQQFDIISVYPNDAVIIPGGHTFRHKENGVEYFYNAFTWSNVRCSTDIKAIKQLSSYEAFTCLKEGSRFDGSAEQLERDENSCLVWSWRKNTSPISENQMNKLIKTGHMKQDEAWYHLLDVNTAKPIVSQNGSIHWNEYRQRWISIRSQIWGDSLLGEIWYFEGDTPLGPWIYGQKIITHAGKKGVDWTGQRKDPYSFYNPVHHPQFDKDGERVIYFEGTYSTAITGGAFATPGYDYNQMMYKLELDEQRLFLPVPVYQVQTDTYLYRTKANLPNDRNKNSIIAFFAPDRPRKNTIPIYEVRNKKDGSVRLTTAKRDSENLEYSVAFYGVQASAEIASDSPTSITVNLYEFAHPNGQRIYSTRQSIDKKGFEKSEKPLCRVWKNPIKFNPYQLASK